MLLRHAAGHGPRRTGVEGLFNIAKQAGITREKFDATLKNETARQAPFSPSAKTARNSASRARRASSSMANSMTGEDTFDAIQSEDRPAPLRGGTLGARGSRRMKFTRLRLSGFKSFVEPTDLLIEPGLTGVVGPNGCGKSNLLEALRWVMGESSYKSMRASGMDDVIFSGTTQRPARNMAEVVVTMANDDRTRTAAVQGPRDARDLAPHRARGGLGLPHQRQGRARPRRAAAVRRCLDRRALAGAGAPGPDRRDHQCQAAGPPPDSRRGRRHHRPSHAPPRGRAEAQAAEQNLTRLDDVTSQLETQLNSLKRQARQATKYKQTFRRDPQARGGMGLYVAGKMPPKPATRDAAALDEATRLLAEHTRAASEKLRLARRTGREAAGPARAGGHPRRGAAARAP